MEKKAQAARSRKIAQTERGWEIDILGDSKQPRSFLYIYKYHEKVRRLIDYKFILPVILALEKLYP